MGGEADSFELDLLAGMLQNDAVLEAAAHHGVDDLFEEEARRRIGRVLWEHHKAHRERLTSSAVLRRCREDADAVKELLERKISPRAVIAEIPIAAKRNRIAAGIDVALRRLEADDVDGSVDALLQCASAPGQVGGKQESKYFEDVSRRMSAPLPPAISTGLPTLDGLLHGGVRRGELACIVAPPKGGKTTFLCNVGFAALRAGLSVVHYTLEAAEWLISSKYDALICEMASLDVQLKKKKAEKLIAAFAKRTKSSLVVRHRPMLSLTLHELEGDLSLARPDLVIVDYGDLMRPSSPSRDAERHNLTALFRGMRGIATKLDVCMWTASQSNRAGVDKEILGMKEVGEDFQKVAVSDLMLSKSQTQSERTTGDFRLFVMASRRSEGMVEIPCVEDFARAEMKEAGDADLA